MDSTVNVTRNKREKFVVKIVQWTMECIYSVALLQAQVKMAVVHFLCVAGPYLEGGRGATTCCKV